MADIDLLGDDSPPGERGGAVEVPGISAPPPVSSPQLHGAADPPGTFVFQPTDSFSLSPSWGGAPEPAPSEDPPTIEAPPTVGAPVGGPTPPPPQLQGFGSSSEGGFGSSSSVVPPQPQPETSSSSPPPGGGVDALRGGFSRLGKQLRSGAEVAKTRAHELDERYQIRAKTRGAVDTARAEAAAAAEKAATKTRLMIGLEHELPGSLQAHGVVTLPPSLPPPPPSSQTAVAPWASEWEEHVRDFGRTWGSGSVGLLGPVQVAQGLAATSVPIEEVLEGTGGYRLDGEDSKLARMEGTLWQTLREAQMEGELAEGEAGLRELARAVVYHLTVNPAIHVVLSHDVQPPALMQPRYVVLVGHGHVRVATYAFAGSPVKGDRPDNKHSPYILRLLSPNLLPWGRAPSPEEQRQEPELRGQHVLCYAARFTRLEHSALAVEEDTLALHAAVGGSGAWDEVFVVPEGVRRATDESALVSVASGVRGGVRVALSSLQDGVETAGREAARIKATAEAERVVRSWLAAQERQAAAPGVCQALAVHGTPRAQWLHTLQNMPPQLLRELCVACEEANRRQLGPTPAQPPQPQPQPPRSVPAASERVLQLGGAAVAAQAQAQLSSSPPAGVNSGDGAAAAPPNVWSVTPLAGDGVGAAAGASFWAAVLTEIYLCNVCACHEILRRNGRG
jgi:hypothetical protein